MANNWKVDDATGEWTPLCEGSLQECKDFCAMYGFSYIVCNERNMLVVL
jgi:hypothetical protein